MTADPIWFRPEPRPTHVPQAPARPEPARVALQIDGRPVEWEEFGRMLMTFEGSQFKLQIADQSEEI